MDGSSDYERVFKEIEEHRICLRKAMLYESFALFLEAKGSLIDACMIYHLGISRFIFFSLTLIVLYVLVMRTKFLITFLYNKRVLAFQKC